MSTLLDRLENITLEIGVFGRVSSGKSSLLNYLLGSEILTIGVTPITALPIRISMSERPEAHVEFTDTEPRTIELSRLAEFCSEQQNPSNVKQVMRIHVKLPAPILQEGATFVDTPGLGSLATVGAEETMAYLPRCDVGILLVDAASAITFEDLAVIEALNRAGSTVMVLISKADLLSSAERQKVVEYTNRLIREQTGLDLQIFPVSVRGEDAVLCDQWVQDQVQPMLARHKEMTDSLLRRKIEGLRQAVLESLKLHLRRQGKDVPNHVNDEKSQAMNALREGEAILDQTRRDIPGMFIKWPDSVDSILEILEGEIPRAMMRRACPETDSDSLSFHL